MTIGSPVGTVHTWRFNTTATLLDGSPISGGPFTSWTVPFHDGDIAISCYGAGGGSDSLVWYRGGGGGGIGADPAEVRKKRDENPQWFADVVAKYGLDRDKEG